MTLYPEFTAKGRVVFIQNTEGGMRFPLCVLNEPEGSYPCYPDHCNCDGPKCVNPFWTDAKIPAPDLDVDHHADQVAAEPEALTALDKAAEAFAYRVPWDDEDTRL